VIGVRMELVQERQLDLLARLERLDRMTSFAPSPAP
jgi:hypothetical protein